MIKFDALTSLTISSIGNFFLAAVFLNVLLHPSENTYFIFNTGVLILFIEFLSIHSSIMIRASKYGKYYKDFFYLKPILFLFYVVSVVSISLIFKNAILPLFFLASLVIKVFSNKAVPDERLMHILLGCFIVSIFAVFILATFISNIFPFQEEVLAQRMEGSSGLFADQPQTLLVWGVIYFLFSGITEIIFFLKKPRQSYVIKNLKNTKKR